MTVQHLPPPQEIIVSRWPREVWGLILAILTVGIGLGGLLHQQTEAIRSRIDRLDDQVQVIDDRTDPWVNLPPDMASGALLDRRLTSIEARLTVLEGD